MSRLYNLTRMIQVKTHTLGKSHAYRSSFYGFNKGYFWYKKECLIGQYNCRIYKIKFRLNSKFYSKEL